MTNSRPRNMLIKSYSNANLQSKETNLDFIDIDKFLLDVTSSQQPPKYSGKEMKTHDLIPTGQTVPKNYKEFEFVNNNKRKEASTTPRKPTYKSGVETVEQKVNENWREFLNSFKASSQKGMAINPHHLPQLYN